MPSLEHLFDTSSLDSWQAEQARQRANAWSPGQGILNHTGARQPEHGLQPPVPVVVRVQWADDGVEYVETMALGWSGRHVYCRMADPRWRFTAVWLDASDVARRDVDGQASD